MTYQIAGIIGSLSGSSVNRALFEGIVRLGADLGMNIAEASIAELPMFSQEREADFPAEARVLKDAIEQADGIMIVTPEYNRSIPGVLKNAIDWASRPWGQNSFAGKPTAIVGGSGGILRTAMAQQHLRDILAFLDARTVNQPEAYVQITPGLIGPDDALADPATRDLLTAWLSVFRNLMEHSA